MILQDWFIKYTHTHVYTDTHIYVYIHGVKLNTWSR